MINTINVDMYTHSKYHIDISLKEFLKILKVRVFCDT